MNARTRLSAPVDPARDHVTGPADARVTLVEYGDYQCTYCRRAHGVVRRLRTELLPGQVRYVFRHLPNARLHAHAPQAAQAAAAQGRFWDMHDYLLDHQDALHRDGLIAAARALGLDVERFAAELDGAVHAPRVQQDMDSAAQSGARVTPTFFINDRRYDGPWDAAAALEAVEKPLGWKIRLLAEQFAGLSVSSGLLMLVGVVLALAWANSPWQGSYHALLELPLGIGVGSRALTLPLAHWINDGLIVLFFFVVGLEIKRELTVGELNDRHRAVFPIAAAVGGMAVPAALYLLLNAGGPGQAGWGVPMASDTAFALGLLAVLGRRVPASVRIFIAAAAIADDVGAILVIALFYTAQVSVPALLAGAGLLALAVALNRARVYRQLPYAVIGVGLWLAVLESGVHPTLAGVLLAFAIPAHTAPNAGELLGQSEAVLRSLESAEPHERTESRYQSAVRVLEAMVERMLSPTQRLERDLRPWSAFVVLPLFALANGGVALAGSAVNLAHPVSLGILAGLVIGKPLGMTLFAWLAVRFGLANRPPDARWGVLAAATGLCGIGFTMSFFVAARAFADPDLLATAKLAVLLASLAAAVVGTLALSRATRPARA